MCKTLIWIALATGALGGCAAPQVAPADRMHPANADAPASTLPGPITTLSVEEPVTASAPSLPRHEMSEQPPPTSPTSTAARLYTCPMHPEVVSDKPGKCPKCGMELVPKNGPEPGHGDHP